MANGFTLDVRADIAAALGRLKHIREEAIDKAAAHSLNRAAEAVRTEGVKQVAGKLGLQQKAVKKAIEVRTKARKSALVAVVEATGKPLNLIEWVRPSRRRVGAFRKQAGVEATPFGQAIVKRGAFIGRGKGSGKLLVLRRIEKKNWKSKLAAQNGPSVPKTFIQREINKALEQLARETFLKNFKHDLEFYAKQ